MADTDVLIVGAGLAGLPIAKACAHAGWQVTIVDRSAAPDACSTDPLDQRCTAIGSASEALLRRWGAWDFIADHAEPIRQVHVSQRGFYGSVRLRAEELSVSSLGHVIENRQWVQDLTAAVAQDDLIQMRRGVSVMGSILALEIWLGLGMSTRTLNSQLC